jgi:pimeloyl-ACP methyl ester carboxylesterase
VTKTVVLIHSPLVGAMAWQPVATILKRDGYRVVMPALSGSFDNGPPYYHQAACSVAAALVQCEPVEPTVFVAHSGAGGLVQVAMAASKRAEATAVFVDAILPHPGKSWMDTAQPPLRARLEGLARDGRLPPWSTWFAPEALAALLPNADLRARFVAELPQVPLAYLEERAPELPALAADRCSYLQLSAAYDDEAREAERLGWIVHRLKSNHLGMLSEPAAVAAAICSLVGDA